MMELEARATNVCLYLMRPSRHSYHRARSARSFSVEFFACRMLISTRVSAKQFSGLPFYRQRPWPDTG
jgi:hypothetical protein